MLIKRKNSITTFHNFYNPALKGESKRLVKERFIRVQKILNNNIVNSSNFLNKKKVGFNNEKE